MKPDASSRTPASQMIVKDSGVAMPSLRDVLSREVKRLRHVARTGASAVIERAEYIGLCSGTLTVCAVLLQIPQLDVAHPAVIGCALLCICGWILIGMDMRSAPKQPDRAARLPPRGVERPPVS
jgi:hypothetical protein